jgi:hypothetical protein
VSDLKGNPHYKILADEKMLPEHGIVHAILTLAFEQRTANILAAQATPEWLNEARVRMGHDTFPPAATPPLPEERDQRCNKPLMDGRNEIRCWGPKDHEGDCT